MHIDNLLDMLAEIADEITFPRFRALSDGDIVEKFRGELVALVRAGEAIASWIWQPVDWVGYAAEQGSGAPLFSEIAPGQYCAGIDYPWVAEGKQDFLRFHKLLPWDHAPGILLLTEAGGVARHLDGTPYRADTTWAPWCRR